MAAGKCVSGGSGSTPLPSKEKKAGGAARSAMTWVRVSSQGWGQAQSKG